MEQKINGIKILLLPGVSPRIHCISLLNATLRLITILAILLLFSACSSTAKYKALKNSRQNNNQQQNKSNYHNDTHLQKYIQDWIGVPYKYGGMSQNGIDCSGFTLTVYSDVFQYELPRTALDQYNSGRRINTSQLTEGDLVFFRGVRGIGIDHVGIYLEKNRFVHASTIDGVTISDLSEDYYKSRYVGACRY